MMSYGNSMAMALMNAQVCKTYVRQNQKKIASQIGKGVMGPNTAQDS